MNSAIERLLTLRVANAMNQQVIHVASHQSMADAARQLLEHSISGAPVVDEKQQCVGILSATDFVKKQGCHCGQEEPSPKRGGQDLLVGEGREKTWRIEERSADLVCHHMSSAVQSIGPEEPLLAAARVMCAEHIHRLPVLDQRGRPVGMITALDIVAALVNAIEE